jgi:hypothetical protein
MEKPKEFTVYEPPVPVTVHSEVLLDTTIRTKEMAAGMGVGTLVGLALGYDLAPIHEQPGLQFAQGFGYLKPLSGIAWIEAEELSEEEWREQVLGKQDNLAAFYEEMRNLYAEVVERLSAPETPRLYVGMGGVLEGHSYAGFYFYCCCAQGTMLAQYWIDPDTGKACGTCTATPC